MKKYSVYVVFKNGQDLQFETDTNIKTLSPTVVNGERCLVTDDEYLLNLRHVKEIEMIEMY